MPTFPVTAYRIEVAPNGGFIEGTTLGGHEFNFVRVPYELTAAIAAVLNGPNAEYDPAHKVFVCSRSLRHDVDRIMATTKMKDDEIALKTFN